VPEIPSVLGGSLLSGILTNWAELVTPRPLVVLFDEADVFFQKVQEERTKQVPAYRERFSPTFRLKKATEIPCYLIIFDRGEESPKTSPGTTYPMTRRERSHRARLLKQL
jgi:hypothetical protein